MKLRTQRLLDDFIEATYEAADNGSLTFLRETMASGIDGGTITDALYGFLQAVDQEVNTKPSIPESTPIDVLLEDVANIGNALKQMSGRIEELESQLQGIDIADLVEENHFLKTYNTFLEHQLKHVRENR